MTNVDAAQVEEQYKNAQMAYAPKKSKFDVKNYLQAKLDPSETKKQLCIRLLPFSKDEPSPFKKVYAHMVKVNPLVSKSGWKQLICPTHNGKGDKCPLCEASKMAYNKRDQTTDEVLKKRYSDYASEFRVKEMWIARCIERGHEEDGPKFWMFADSRKKTGIYDSMMNSYQIRRDTFKQQGTNYNIFDLNCGEDFFVMVNRNPDGKTSTTVMAAGVQTPLTTDFDLGNKWINDEKKWDDVFTIKPYDYMKIIAEKGQPVFDKEKQCYVNKSANPIAEGNAAMQQGYQQNGPQQGYQQQAYSQQGYQQPAPSQGYQQQALKQNIVMDSDGCHDRDLPY